MLFSVLVLGALVAAIAFSSMQVKLRDSEWIREISIKDEVVMNTTLWLSDIEDYEVDKGWVEAMADEMSLNELLEIKTIDNKHGTYQKIIEKESYERCAACANELIQDCLNTIIANKLEQAGYTDTVTAEMVQKLVTDILGCDIDQYFVEKHIQMIPSYEELQNRLSETGEYEISGEMIEWKTDTKEELDVYIIKNNFFILTDKSIVYSKYDKE